MKSTPRKLSPDQVLEARQRRAAGESLKSIGQDLGVSESAISRVCAGKAWAKIGERADAAPGM